jgi:hypothetical protein
MSVEVVCEIRAHCVVMNFSVGVRKKLVALAADLKCKRKMEISQKVITSTQWFTSHAILCHPDVTKNMKSGVSVYRSSSYIKTILYQIRNLRRLVQESILPTLALRGFYKSTMLLGIRVGQR